MRGGGADPAAMMKKRGKGEAGGGKANKQGGGSCARGCSVLGKKIAARRRGTKKADGLGNRRSLGGPIEHFP